MSHQIIKQLDGRYCVYDTVSDTLVHIDLTREELLQAFVESYTEMVTEEINRVTKAIDDKESPYKHQTVSYAEALLNHLRHGFTRRQREDYDEFQKAFLSQLEAFKKHFPGDIKEAAKKVLPQGDWGFYGVADICAPSDSAIPNGTRVKTLIDPDREGNDWTESAKQRRKSGVTGTVIAYHDSHGLCYDVRHDEGGEGCYDPWELRVL